MTPDVSPDYGRWTVIGDAPRDRFGDAQLLCRCKCGTEKSVPIRRLVKGLSKSCGCLSADLARERMLGTKRPNAGVTGESHYAAKLTADSVRQARRLRTEGYSLSEILDHLGIRVDKSALSLAITGKTWKSVPIEPVSADRRLDVDPLLPDPIRRTEDKARSMERSPWAGPPEDLETEEVPDNKGKNRHEKRRVFRTGRGLE